MNPFEATRQPTAREKRAARDRRIFGRSVFDGVSGDQLAREHGLSTRRVNEIVQKFKSQLEREVIDHDLMAMASLHLVRLEHQWHELSHAWSESKREELTVKIATDADGKKRVEQMRKSRTGDVRYLEQARRVLENMRELASLLSNHGKELPDDVETITLEQRREEVHRLLEDHCRARPVVSHVGVAQRPEAARLAVGGPGGDAG